MNALSSSPPASDFSTESENRSLSPVPALEIRGLEKHFPAFHLGPVDLTVPRGSIYGFIGPNGAGKSTLIDLIFRMGDADAGTVRVSGLDHRKDERAVKLRTAYVSPELGFKSWPTVGKALTFLSGFYPDWSGEKCTALLRDFDLRTTDKTASLSFGQRMKLSLTAALSRRAELLVLDEPTSGLDAVAKQVLFTELLRAVESGERSVFISSHSLTELERLADHVGFIHRGRMILEGRMDEVTERWRRVDFTWPAETPPPAMVGLKLLSRHGHRCRALADRTGSGLEELRRAGAEIIAETPVTLEELFLDLVAEPAGFTPANEAAPHFIP